MRALIRGTEICLENAWTKWQRMNMLFLTGKEKDVDGNPLKGDGWTLVEDYQEPMEDPEEFFERAGVGNADTKIEFTIQERGFGVNHMNNPVSETVTIDGKTYTKDELLALLNQTS